VFQTYRIFPLIILALFGVIYFQIKKSIMEAERTTEVGKKIFELQLKTMKNLKHAIWIFFTMSMFLSLYDFVAALAANSADKNQDCQNNVFTA
jgi:hypothetical protein